VWGFSRQANKQKQNSARSPENGAYRTGDLTDPVTWALNQVMSDDGMIVKSHTRPRRDDLVGGTRARPRVWLE